MDGLELESLDSIKSLLLISLGGLLGSNLRFFIFQSLDNFFIDKDIRNVLINNFASFLLGFFFAFLTNNSSLEYSYELGLLIFIGFLGSLSTFSGFIYELSCDFKSFKMLKILIFSIILGLTCLFSGFVLGNQ